VRISKHQNWLHCNSFRGLLEFLRIGTSGKSQRLQVWKQLSSEERVASLSTFLSLKFYFSVLAVRINNSIKFQAVKIRTATRSITITLIHRLLPPRKCVASTLIYSWRLLHEKTLFILRNVLFLLFYYCYDLKLHILSDTWHHLNAVQWLTSTFFNFFLPRNLIHVRCRLSTQKLSSC